MNVKKMENIKKKDELSGLSPSAAAVKLKWALVGEKYK